MLLTERSGLAGAFLLLLPLGLGLACSSESGGSVDSQGQQGTGGTGGNASTVATGASSTSQGATSAGCGSYVVDDDLVDVPASDPGIRYVGRFDFANPDAPRLAFPAVSIETVFEGDAIDLRLLENAGGGATTTAYYDVTIDDEPPIKLQTCRGQEAYPLARDLDAGPHRVRISKRTEAQVGTASFLGFRIKDGSALSLPESPARLLEFVGDSITCGYGNEVATTDPASFTFTSANENALLSYAGQTARALDADFVAVAASGRGMVRNYAGGAGLTAPEFYELSAPVASWPAWSAAGYTPDVIVVNLGTNDFSIGLTEDELVSMREDYRGTYQEFLERLRELYSGATLIAAVGPMLSDSYPEGYQAWTSIRADVQEVVDALAAGGDSDVHYYEFARTAVQKWMRSSYRQPC